jgi:hypothetical protein
MIKDILNKRFTAKWWAGVLVEQSKIDNILECAYLSPSKQGKFDYEIYVITDSPEGKDFKKWLYWENTYCLDGVRGKEGPGLRRYNGQVIAPIVLLWVGKKIQGYSDTNELEDQRVRDDIIVSATVAMLAAEELGLKTGLNGCIGAVEIEEKLQLENKTPVMALGIGYAFTENRIARQVYNGNFVLTHHPNNDYKAHSAIYELIIKNKDFIKKQAIAWMDHQIVHNIPPFSNYQYDSQKCNRDLEFVLLSWLNDLQFDEHSATTQTITNYWTYGVLRVRGFAEKAVYTFLEDLIKNYILKNIPAPEIQSEVAQVIEHTLVADEQSVIFIEKLFSIIQNGLNGIGLLKEVGFDYANTNPSSRSGKNRKDRPPLADMIKYI